MMACGYMNVKGTDPDSGEDYDENINSCLRKEACDGWSGTIEGVEVEVFSCGATKLLASLAATVATVYLM